MEIAAHIASAWDEPESGWPRDAAPALRAVPDSALTIGEVPSVAMLREEWQALAADAAEANAFAEPWFVEAGLRHLAEGKQVRLIEARDGAGGLVGVLPLCVRRDYGRIGVRHVENWRHHHDFLGGPLVRDGFEQRFWQAVIRHLDGQGWAKGFLHVTGLVEGGRTHLGLEAAARSLGRRAPIVHRTQRAALASDLTPAAYLEATVRKKKRKELKRLQNRLGEEGRVEVRRLAPEEPLEPWSDAFLALESSGWKGRAGSALASSADTEGFFRDALAGARAAGRLEMLQLDLDGRPLAMLVNFLTPPGSFSFKIAHDEAFARFSPGVLIQLANLDILSRSDIDWMDSCAAQDHPMIDHLWAERRNIVRVTVPLSGFRRRATYSACRILELGSAGRWAALGLLGLVD